MRQFSYFVENVTIPEQNARKFTRTAGDARLPAEGKCMTFPFPARGREKNSADGIFSAKIGVSWQKLYGLQVYNTAS
jgi:hypothetical protein